jgi:hypothetical protein
VIKTGIDKKGYNDFYSADIDSAGGEALFRASFALRPHKAQIPSRSKLDPITVKFALLETFFTNFCIIGSIQSVTLPH